MTASVFNIHQCTASKHIHAVCEAINSKLGPDYLYLPKNNDEMREKVSEFEMRFGLLQAFACHGTHLPIKRPVKNSQNYFGYQFTHIVAKRYISQFLHSREA